MKMEEETLKAYRLGEGGKVCVMERSGKCVLVTKTW